MLKAFVLLLFLALHADRGAWKSWVEPIATIVESDELPPGWTAEQTAAVLVVTGYEESGWATGPRGDRGITASGSACTFQILTHSEADARSLEANPTLCVRRALAIIRESVKRRICASKGPEYVLSSYCGGCGHPLAEAISRRRMLKAFGVLGDAIPPL